MNPRRLTFAVGTTLLTASLSTTVGCKKATVNEGPEQPHVNEAQVPEDEHVNEGPEEDPATEEPASEEEQPDGPNVNTVAPE